MGTRESRLSARLAALALRRGPIGAASRAINHYRVLHVEYDALKVVGRGLFLAVFLLMAFLLILDRVTNAITGINEIIIPTTDVPLDLDLGAVVRGTLTRASAAVLTVVGVTTFAISAVATARALQSGARRVLRPHGPPHAPRGWVSTVAVAGLVSVTVVASWVLALGTALRTRVLEAFTGTSLTSAAVASIKLVLILAMIALVATITHGCARRIVRHALPASSWTPCVLLGVVMAALNLFFLYTNVGALLNPSVSVGIVLILTLLTWVNLATRSVFVALCSIGALHDRGSDNGERAVATSMTPPAREDEHHGPAG